MEAQNLDSTIKSAAMAISESSSTHRSAASAGFHRFTIKGHSLEARIGAGLKSKPFWVGGYEWTILYYPNGMKKSGHEHYTSVFLVLNNAGEGGTEVTPFFSFSCLQDPSAESPKTTADAAEEEKKELLLNSTFNSKKYVWGRFKFMSKADLATSGYLKNDCLVIKCSVEIITKELTYDDDQGFMVPPSDLTQQLGHLLESGDATDITIQVGGTNKEVFKGHRCVLTARSPVFRAMLCGSMRESKEDRISIHDMEPRVFEVLLHYMYHDDLPLFMIKEEAEVVANMAQDVLVAADLYGMERLKLMCESMLSKAMDVYTVCSTLVFADQHGHQRLKDSCLAYMLKDRERLKVILRTEGFKELSQTSVSLVRQVLEKVLEIY